MAARLVRVAGEREPADDRAVVLGDEDGRVGVAAQRPQVATLVGDAAPAVRVQEPAPGSRPTAAASATSVAASSGLAGRIAIVTRRRSRGRLAVGRPRPRACRPRAARPRRRRRRRGCGPPSERHSSPPGAELRRGRLRDGGSSPSTWMRGRSIASATGSAAQHGVRDLRDRAGEANRAGAAEGEPRAAVLEHERRRHHARQPRAGARGAFADHVELAEHVVQLRAAAEDPRAGAERRRERGGVAVGVDHGDVRRAGNRAAAARTA